MTDWLHSLIVQMEQMGGPGVVLFILVYIAAAVTMAPAFPLTVAAGAIYGVARGSVVVFISCVLGGSLAYLVAIKLTGTRLLSRYDRDPRVMVVRAAMREDSIWVQFLLRLSPIVPFTMLNYALGFARVRVPRLRRRLHRNDSRHPDVHVLRQGGWRRYGPGRRNHAAARSGLLHVPGGRRGDDPAGFCAHWPGGAPGAQRGWWGDSGRPEL